MGLDRGRWGRQGSTPSAYNNFIIVYELHFFLACIWLIWSGSSDSSLGITYLILGVATHFLNWHPAFPSCVGVDRVNGGDPNARIDSIRTTLV